MRDADRLGAPHGALSGAQSGALSGLPEDPEARIRALLARNAELASALRHRDEFLVSMSHELRTPLNAVLGLTDALLEGLAGDLSTMQRGWIADINASGAHLLGLINELLDLARIEAGRFDPHWQLVTPSELAEGAVRLVMGNAIARGVALATAVVPELPAIVTDARAARQILVNLLGNAVKFTPAGRAVRLEVHAGERAGTVVFSIIDEGIGIPPERLAEIFEPFVQLDGERDRHGSGTGLGLALSARMARELGGDIAVESVVDAGSTFRVTLGRSDGEDTAAVATGDTVGEVSDQSVYLRPGTRALVVDDSAENRETFGRYLRAKGFVVEVAADGVEAVERAATWRPDVVLMDLQMPRLDGWQATRTLRAHPVADVARVPIIAVTALAMPGDRERALAAGADAYLAKPVRMRELLRTITEVVTAPR